MCEKVEEREKEEKLLQAELGKQFEASSLNEQVSEVEAVEDCEVWDEAGVVKDSLVSVEDFLKKRNMVEVKGLASTALRLVLNDNHTK